MKPHVVIVTCAHYNLYDKSQMLIKRSNSVITCVARINEGLESMKDKNWNLESEVTNMQAKVKFKK